MPGFGIEPEHEKARTNRHGLSLRAACCICPKAYGCPYPWLVGFPIAVGVVIVLLDDIRAVLEFGNLVQVVIIVV